MKELMAPPMPDFPLQKQLAELKATLEADPANIELAQRYWATLGSFAGNDVRSGGYLIEAFRGCALASKQGTIAFARAYQELSRKTGENPEAQLFDEDLARALKARLPELSATDRARVEWIVAFLK